MRISVKYWISRIFLTVLVFCTLTPASFAVRGTDVGSGGDSYALEFIAVAKELKEILAQNPLPGVNLEAYSRAIAETKVSSQPDLSLEGRPVDAINYPAATPPRIVVSRAGWDRVKAHRQEKLRLVFHEFLSILKLDDSGYGISTQLRDLSFCERSPSVRETLERELGIACERMIESDLARLGSDLVIGGGGKLKKGDFRFFERFHLAFDYQIYDLDPDTFEGGPWKFSTLRVGKFAPGAFSGTTGGTFTIEAVENGSRLAPDTLSGLVANKLSFKAAPGALPEGFFRNTNLDALYLSTANLPATLTKSYLSELRNLITFAPILKHVEKLPPPGYNMHPLNLAAEAFEGWGVLKNLALELNVGHSDLSNFRYLSSLQWLHIGVDNEGDLPATFFDQFSKLKYLRLDSHRAPVSEERKNHLATLGFRCKDPFTPYGEGKTLECERTR